MTYIYILDQSRLLGALVALAQSILVLKCCWFECKYKLIIVYAKIFINLTTVVGLSEVCLIFENFLGPRLRFVMGQIRAVLRSPRGYRWTSYGKGWALCLLCSSPCACWVLRRIFVLSSLRILWKVMEKVDTYRGFSQPILKVLQYKIGKLLNKGKK